MLNLREPAEENTQNAVALTVINPCCSSEMKDIATGVATEDTPDHEDIDAKQPCSSNIDAIVETPM